MSNHQKRLSVPKSWPVERKTETFTVKAGAGPHGESGVPLLIVLRDVLGYVDSRKEARYALDQGSVLINGTAVSDEERPVGMFDILAFTEREEYYRVFPGQGGRLSLTPIDEDSAGSKLGKVVNKQHVPGGAVQLTLHDGQTLVVEDGSYDTDDSLVVANDDDAIVARFEYEEGALVTAVSGEHAGEVGRIDEIQVTPGSADNIVRVEQDDGAFETVEDYVVVIDENFTEESDEDVTEESDEDVTEESDEDEDEDEEADADEKPEADEEEADAEEVEAEDEGDDAGDDEAGDADADADGADAEADDEDGDGGDDE
ncbi:30S ribosomal protein S4e [Halobacteriales archaeon QS_5_68_33]|nr:MAG: 30S ribosomal protein S4e [Halobacteriales archaeon QS_5_68_33]